MSHRSSRSWGCSLGGEAYPSAAEQPRVICPLATQLKAAVNEPSGLAAKSADNSLKAYKLGKRRWSYNQCQLIVQQEDGSEQLNVMEAMANGNDSIQGDYQESGVVYLVRLNNGQRVKVHIFVVYDDPQAIQHAAKPGEDCFQWTCVQRSACKKGCDGPILRAIQRYGRLGRRSGGPDTLADEEEPASKSGRQRSKTSKAAAASAHARREKDHELKDARFMYLSIDEASTHVGVRFFRLLVGVYTQDGECLLGTAVSNQIRVLANNDVPTGAAFIPLVVPVAHNWEGWAPVQPRSRRERTGRSSRYSSISTPSSPATRSPTKEHTRSQSSSDTSHPRHSLPDSPEMRSAHRRHLPPPLTGGGGGGGGLDGTLLDMHSAVGAGPTSAFSAAFAAHMEPLQMHGEGPAQQLHHAPLPPPLLHIRSGTDHHHLHHPSPHQHAHEAVGLPVPGSGRRSSGISGAGFGTLQLQSSPSMDTSSCRWTVSPNVHTSMSSMARTSSGNGSFKRSRSGAVATPTESGSPVKGSRPASMTPSPVETPAGELSPFKAGGGPVGSPLSPTMQQRRQAALHAHLVRQRLAAEAAAGRQQLGGAEHGGADGLQLQHPMRQPHGLLADGGSRLLPSHVHAPAGTHLQLEGGQFRGGASATQAFHATRSLPAHMYQLHDDHTDALLPQIFHDTEAGDCHFSQTPRTNVSDSASPSLHGFGAPGNMLHDAEWLLSPAELHGPPDTSPPEAGAAHGGSGGGDGMTKTVSAVSLPPISAGYLASRSASLELAALAEGVLHGRAAGEERFGSLPPDV